MSATIFSPGTWSVRKGHWRHSWFIVIQKLEERRNRPELVKAYHEPTKIVDAEGKPALAIASLDALQMDPSKTSAQNLAEAEANAHLFAASKDLYEALDSAHLLIIRLLNEGDFKKHVTLDLGFIVDALDKAKGGTNGNRQA